MMKDAPTSIIVGAARERRGIIIMTPRIAVTMERGMTLAQSAGRYLLTSMAWESLVAPAMQVKVPKNMESMGSLTWLLRTAKPNMMSTSPSTSTVSGRR